MDLKQLTLDSTKIVAKVGLFIQQELQQVKATDIETKALNSLVSYVDKNAEIQLVEALGSLLPESTFLTEEETVEQETGKYMWIIDPLDGTTNFLHQLPFFSISVALQQEDEIILGIVYEVNRQECFYAWKNGGAYLNGKKIQTKSTNHLKDTLIATGFPYYDFDKIPAYLEVLTFFIKNTRGIRRLGSAALDLAYVACGRFDGFYEYSLNAWDVAAGIILVKEAGGKVADFQGGNNFLFGKEMIASNPYIFQEIVDVVEEAFYSKKLPQ